MAFFEVDVRLSGFSLIHFAAVTSLLRIDESTSTVIHASIRPPLIIIFCIYHAYLVRHS